MKDIRGIFLFLEEKLVLKQIFHVIEKEIRQETGSKFVELPDENKIHSFLKNRSKGKQKTSIDPKETSPLKLLEEIEEDKKSAKEEKKEFFEYPIEQKLGLINQFLMKIDSNEFLSLIYERGDYTLILFPRGDDFIVDGIKKFNSIIKNSNFYACAQFGFKLIDFIYTNNFQESTADALDVILINCVPFGRIIDDDFEAFATLLYEEEEPGGQLEKVIKNPPAQSKIVFRGLVKKLDVLIEENIICYQFGRESMQDIQKIEGTIGCSVDTVSDEEISLVISNLKETILQGLILDLDGSVENSLMTGNKSLKIDYLIPNHKDFRVCHYSFPSIEQPPVLGSYQRKQLSENCFRVRIKLDVLKQYRRYVKNLKIQLRLDPSKAIASTELLANEGKVQIIGSKVLVWHIPNVVDTEEDLCLSGNLNLKANEQWKGQEKLNLTQQLLDIKQNNGLSFSCLTEDDILFCMPEKFLELEFEMQGHLVSEMQVNPNQVSIFPTRKLDIMIEKISRSKKYFIFLDEDWDTFDFTHMIHCKNEEI